MNQLEHTVTTIGSATIAAVPDLAVITLAVECRHTGAQGAFDAAATAAARVLAAIGETAPGALLTTRGVGLRAETAWRDEQTVVTGYVSDSTLLVSGLPIDAASAVLHAAVAAGGDDVRIQSLEYELADEHEARNGAREDAFADARAKAGQLAQLAGRTLGAAVVIEEIGENTVSPLRAAGRDMKLASMPVMAGEKQVGAGVSVRWELI
ncbi:SIMPL domain-containing protein [Paeniglutamicibacter cryotolerans]|uniref:DUF541 domain-containing protein n=1 Tax=Paeniglutamicibacter cryotolerans TaxID=670079 RepID=A0A839QK52_9MICC|nr:SIMPL domain-containing protein [Paeniglutamicibacter cryotolerans]MBB2996210.1 hypothetical protein [Paeniglutamicibacter cryotolerans]